MDDLYLNREIKATSLWGHVQVIKNIKDHNFVRYNTITIVNDA